ncbi:MAG: hypothetical protein IJI66_13155 [Erysipelotrichaceae bacterium]|nr:hypothetical protein [Erysipelotrichaceae bacterium]
MRKIINIILSLCLAGTVGATGFFGYRIFENSRKVIVPDFLGKNVSEVIEWCGKLSEPHGCEFVYEDSTTIDKDKVFKQSVSADNELTDKLIITVSSGLIQEIALPALNDNTTRADIEAWAQQNNIRDILFVEDENNDKINGTVLKIEPQPVYPNSEVIVHIAKSTKEKEPETPTTQDGEDIVIKAGTYVGLSEDDFKSKATSLGLKANHNSNKDDYSSTVEKGKVVWHGSGTYEKGEKFNYGLSLGKSSSSSSTSDNDLYIEAGTYVGKTESEIKMIATNLGLVPTHVSSRDSYSDTVAKDSIVTHGYGQYEKGEAFNYGLSLGKKGSDTTDDDLYVTYGQYIGKTESEFKTIATNKGLVANHKSTLDDYSDTVAKGNVVWHGSGQYEKDELFNYGLSLGKKGSDTSDDDLYIKAGTYVGKTEDEFKTIATNKGLKPNHKSEKDQYSDSIAKGSIVWHGSGQYVKDEAFNYGLSLGKQESTQTIQVSADQYVGKTENEFKTIAQTLGLNPTHLTSRDSYSDTVAKGSIVSHGYGSYTKGEDFNYGLSLGKKETPVVSTVYIMRPNYYSASDTFDGTKQTILNALGALQNLTFQAVTSTSGEAVGQITKITVGGDESYSAGNYTIDTPVVVYIVSKQGN